MDDRDLEQLVDRELSRLPMPHAPRTLLPRVMAAIDAAFLPWHARGWFAWPWAYQGLSAALFVALVAVGVIWLPDVGRAAADTLGGRLALWMPAALSEGFGAMDRMWVAADVIWRALVQPLSGYVIVFVLAMSAACVAFGTALSNLALGGASEL